MPCNFPFAVGATAISLRETRKIAVYFNSCLHLWHFIFALQKRSHPEQQKPFRKGTVFMPCTFRQLLERQRFHTQTSETALLLQEAHECYAIYPFHQKDI